MRVSLENLKDRDGWAKEGGRLPACDISAMKQK